MFAEVILSLFLVWLVWYVITTYLTRKGMPPGPFPFPFIGNLPHLLCDPVNPYNKLAEKYGDIFTITLPSGNVVVVSTASFARETRSERSEDITGKFAKTIYPWHEMFGEDLITMNYSPLYRFRRSVFKSAMHVFGAGVEQAYERARNAVDLMIKDIEMRKGQSFSPKRLFESSTLAMLWEWLTSKQVQLDDPAIKDLSKFCEIVAKQALLSNFYQIIPFSTYLPTQFNHDIKQAQQIRDDIFPAELCAHIESYTPGVVRDLTDGFINAYKKEIAKESNKDIGRIEDISGLMLDVIFAGSDTTSTSLAWLFLFLVVNPGVQEKIHDELDAVVGSCRLPGSSDVQKMPYLQATLCEVERASGLMVASGTNAICDTIVAGYRIPKGTFVLVNYAKLHHDEREWPEPEKFKPERFLDVDGKFVGWTKRHGFLPFSVGRRECPGQSLAKIGLFTFASMLLQRYKIEIPEGEETPTTEVFSPALIMRPTNFKVVAKKRYGFTN